MNNASKPQRQYHAQNAAVQFKPTPREIRWFAHIARHGPQSSEFFFELTRDTHRCRDTALRRLQALRAAGYLYLPVQQRAIANADFHPYVYELGLKRRAEFRHWGIEHSLTRPTGHWWHAFMTSCITSAVEICSKRIGDEYIPGDRILALKGTKLGIPIGRQTVVPDQLFAVRSKAGFRSYVLEVDRGTEPVQSRAARKSLRASVECYGQILRGQIHKQHYGLKSNLIVLWVFTSATRREKFLGLVQKYATDQSAGFMTLVVESGFTKFAACVESVDGVWRGLRGRDEGLFDEAREQNYPGSKSLVSSGRNGP